MRPVLRWSLAALGLALLVAAAVAAVTYDRYVRHPRFLAAPARATHAQLLASGLELVTPSGSGPFPTVLLIHGCGGLHGDKGPNPIMAEYARSAVEAERERHYSVSDPAHRAGLGSGARTESLAIYLSPG